MVGWLERRIALWREGRKRRQTTSVQTLKARYHTFRALLDDNSKAILLITEIDRQLRSASVPGPELGRQIAALLEASGSMVDKLLSLDGHRFHNLRIMQEKLAARIRELLATLPAPAELHLYLPLAAIGPQTEHEAGGKAASLARLRKLDCCRVPDGFVVPVHACRLFLEQNGLFLEVTAKLRNGLRQAAGPLPEEVEAAVTKAICAAPLPAVLNEALLAAARPFLAAGGLAVRSSAVSEDSQIGRAHV